MAVILPVLSQAMLFETSVKGPVPFQENLQQDGARLGNAWFTMRQSGVVVIFVVVILRV
jgi:hypothetical protein